MHVHQKRERERERGKNREKQRLKQRRSQPHMTCYLFKFGEMTPTPRYDAVFKLSNDIMNVFKEKTSPKGVSIKIKPYFVCSNLLFILWVNIFYLLSNFFILSCSPPRVSILPNIVLLHHQNYH